MATIITRVGKGSPLTFAELDANFTNLNNDKLERNGSVAITGNLNITSASTIPLILAGSLGTAPVSLDAGQLLEIRNNSTAGAEKRLLAFGQIDGDVFIRTIRAGAGPNAAGLRFYNNVHAGTITGNGNWVINPPVSGHSLTVNASTAAALSLANTGPTDTVQIQAATNAITIALIGRATDDFASIRWVNNPFSLEHWSLSGEGANQFTFYRQSSPVWRVTSGANFTVLPPPSGDTLQLTQNATGNVLRLIGRASDNSVSINFFNNANTTRTAGISRIASGLGFDTGGSISATIGLPNATTLLLESPTSAVPTLTLQVFSASAGAISFPGNSTSTSATAGTNGATPSQVAGYIRVIVNGTLSCIPYYNS